MLYSLSKQSNMAGYRTALIAGDYRLVKEMAEYRKQIGQIIPGPVQAAMAAGLKDTAAVHEQWRRYRRRLSALVDALKAYGYSAQMPSGALYVWVKAKSGDCWADMAELAKIGIIPAPANSTALPPTCVSPPPPATRRSLPQLSAWRAKPIKASGNRWKPFIGGVRGSPTPMRLMAMCSC